METSRNILDLPLELLNQVFDYLHEHDQCALAWTHPVLGQAFIYHAGNRYNNIYPSFQFKTWSYILPLCGSTVLNIEEDFHILDEYLMRLIEQYCTNLQSISIGINERNCYRVKTFLANLKSLRSVRIWIECAATPKIFRVLKKIKYLKGLEFLRYVGREEREISNFAHLENLSIAINSSKTNIDVLDWCLALKKLRCLKLAGFEVWQSIHGPNENIDLEELVIIDCCVTSQWPIFHQLRTLKASYSNWTRSHHQFVLKHAKTLKVLALSFVLSANEFFEILIGCKNLRYLEIQNLQMQIDKEDFVIMISILKENGVTPQKPFEIELGPIRNYLKKLLVHVPGSEIIRFNSHSAHRNQIGFS